MLSNYRAAQRRRSSQPPRQRPSPIGTTSVHDGAGDDPRWRPPSQEFYDDQKYLGLAMSMGVTPKSIPTEGLPSRRSSPRSPTSFFPNDRDDRDPFTPFSTDTRLTDVQAFLKGRKRTVENYTYKL